MSVRPHSETAMPGHEAMDVAKAAGLPMATKPGDFPWAYKERVLAAINAAYSMGLKACDPSGQAQYIERIDAADLDAAEKAITERIGTAPFIPADSNHIANITLHMIRELRAARQQQASGDAPLFIGACITEGRLHATVHRLEANGHVTLVATADMDAAALQGRDCMTEMQPQQAGGDVAAAAREVLSHVVGALPTLGYLRDNDRSRAALGRLREAIACTTEPAAQGSQTMAWPKARDVGRFGDMHPLEHLRVGLDSDNDVYVSVWGEDGGASVEFCNPGGGGGGSSRRTREALIALMVAMEADNADRPDKDWWARREGNGAQAKLQEGGAA